MNRLSSRRPILGALVWAAGFVVPFAAVGVFMVPTFQIWLIMTAGSIAFMFVLSLPEAIRRRRAIRTAAPAGDRIAAPGPRTRKNERGDR